MTWRQRLGTVAVLSAMAMVVLDAGLLNIALPTLGRALGETPSRTILAMSAYQTALVVGLLPSAQLAERIGYRRLFAAGILAFNLASSLCALAPTLAALVAARILQGLGGAAIMALGIALLRFALGPRRLGAAIGWNALTVALCTAAAPILGAAILAGASWPWLFLAKLPIGLLALAAAAALPEVAPTRASVDPAAMLLHAAIATLVLVAAQAALAIPVAAALLAGLAAALGAQLVRRDRRSAAPLWPVDLLAIRPLRVAFAASICCFVGQSAAFLALPFYLQPGLGHGPGATALVLTCWPLAVAVAGPFANGLAERFGSAALCTTGALMLAAGLLAASLWPVGPSIIPFAIAASLAGIGFGLFQVPNNRTLFLLAPPERSAAAGAVQGSARLVGQALGALLIGVLLACLPPVAAARLGLGMASFFTILAASVSALALPARPGRMFAYWRLEKGRIS